MTKTLEPLITDASQETLCPCGDGRRLVPHTVMRLEAYRHVDSLYGGLPSEDGGGWRIERTRDFDRSITVDDIASFVAETYGDVDAAKVADTLFTRYRCMCDDGCRGFVLKSKTVFTVEGDAAAPKVSMLHGACRACVSAWGWLRANCDSLVNDIKGFFKGVSDGR